MKLLLLLLVACTLCREYGAQQHFPCDQICDEEVHQSPACGSDGVTYQGKCDYNNAACKAHEAGHSLTIEYPGPCINLNSTCDQVSQVHRCESFHVTPVNVHGHTEICGSDGVTYRSVCSFMHAHCRPVNQFTHPHPVNLNHTGPCVHTSNMTVDCGQYVVDNSGLALEGGNAYPLSIGVCPRDFHPICSLKGHTYSNACSFCMMLVRTQQITADNLEVPVAHDGICSGVLIG